MKVFTNTSSQNLEKRISHSNTTKKSLIFDSSRLLKLRFYVLPRTYIHPPQTYIDPPWTYIGLPQTYVGHVQVCPYCHTDGHCQCAHDRPDLICYMQEEPEDDHHPLLCRDPLESRKDGGSIKDDDQIQLGSSTKHLDLLPLSSFIISFFTLSISHLHPMME